MKIAEGCTFHHVEIAPDRQIPAHTQESIELSLIVRGSGRLYTGMSSVRPFSSGELVLIPSGIRHHWAFGGNGTERSGTVENITLMLGRSFLRQLSEIFPALSEDMDRILGCRDVIVFDRKHSCRMRDTLLRMAGESGKEQAVSLMSVLSDAGQYMEAPENLHICVQKGNGHAEQRLETVFTYVSCNYSRRITIDDIARYTGMNRSAFCRFFHKHTGTTFIRYLNEYRINIARELLRLGDMSVSEICYAAGFNDTSYFCRAFRKHSGFPPSKA